MKVAGRARVLLCAAGLSGWIGFGGPRRAPGATVPTPSPPNASSLRILSDVTLPAAYEHASSIRWAGEHSVYLGLGIDGLVETNLPAAATTVRELIPGKSKPGGFWAISRLAASSQYVVAAGPAAVLTWRRLSDPTREELPFMAPQGIDVRENRLAIVGLQRDDKGKPGPDGAIAWVGSLDRKLADLKVVLYDVGGPGAPGMDRCVGTPLGAVRFLADGSLVVAPGVEPGINLYDPQGNLLRTWDTGVLGIDTDCASLSYDQSRHLLSHGVERQGWLNERRIVEAILPLPQGIGLLIRRFEEGRTRWSLKVLRKDGSVATYTVPIEGANGFFYLPADSRGEKIVFVLHETVFASQGRQHAVPARLIVAELPH
jgi:hypothetical protein